jgi:hypothetical protein
MDGLRAVRGRPGPLHQELDVSRDLGPQVRELNNDVASTVIVTYEGVAVGSIELPAHIEEPLLPWLVRELGARLRDELLMEITRRALPVASPLNANVLPAFGGSVSAAG